MGANTRVGLGWDGMGWDGMGWDGMGWDGMDLVPNPSFWRFTGGKEEVAVMRL